MAGVALRLPSLVVPACSVPKNPLSPYNAGYSGMVLCYFIANIQRRCCGYNRVGRWNSASFL
ncbi:MAG: hypothetical protein JWN45_2980 [Acidobacteriaceae bacterium]|nr:hypothetical protein [Acidobacteriaceae bacterium]